MMDKDILMLLTTIFLFIIANLINNYFFKKPSKPRQLIGMFLMSMGLAGVMIRSPDASFLSPEWMGSILALISLVGGGGALWLVEGKTKRVKK